MGKSYPNKPFEKGNQMGKLAKGVPKKKAIPTELLQIGLDHFTEEKVNFLINQLSARDQLTFMIKCTELLLKRQTDEVQLQLMMERLRQLENQLNPIDITSNITIGYTDPKEDDNLEGS